MTEVVVPWKKATDDRSTFTPDDVEEIRGELSLEQAAERIKKLEAVATDLEKHRMIVRWYQGETAAHTKVIRGEKTMDQLAEAAKVHVNTLLEAKRVYEHFNGNFALYHSWLSEDNRNWLHAQGLIRAGSNPDVLGAEKFVDRFINRVERLIQDAERVREAIQLLPPSTSKDVSEQLDGAMSTLGDTLASVDLDRVGEIGHEEAARDREFLHWIHGFVCPFTGDTEVHAHHAFGESGTAEKGSDYGAVPASPSVHIGEIHQKGPAWVEKKYGFTLEELALNILHYWITYKRYGRGQSLTMKLYRTDVDE